MSNNRGKTEGMIKPKVVPAISPIDSDDLDKIGGGTMSEPSEAFVKISGPSWVNHIVHKAYATDSSKAEPAPKISLADLYQVVAAKNPPVTLRT